MKYFTLVFALCFSALAFGQINLKVGDKIKAGKIILKNNKSISFYNLEYGAGEKLSYINPQNLEAEFLFTNSVKSVETKVISESEIAEIDSKVDGTYVDPYETYQFLDKSIQLKKPQPGNSVVYFVRTNSMGAMINFRHFDYDKFIGKFSGEGFMRYECDPGEHVFWVGASNSSYVKANLEADKIYIIETIPEMGIAYAVVNIELIEKSDEKKIKKQKKRLFATLSNKNLDRSPSIEDLAQQSDYEKEIENGIKNYNERLEKNKVHILNPDQFFE